MRRADHRERDAGVARRGLKDRLAGHDRALGLGVLDEGAGDAVLDRAGGVARLELCPDAHARLGRETRELHERRVADRLDDVSVAPSAGLVTDPLDSHYFTEYSGAWPKRQEANMLVGEMSADFDYDWLVIGSGFGGSVSALRLSEKGYKVGVLECGRRFADHEFPESTSDYKRYFWRPKIGWKGIFRLTTFKDVSVVSGCGVGGGSLGYANTLYVPPKPFFEDAQWSGIARLGVRARAPLRGSAADAGGDDEPHDDPADALLRELGEELGVSDTYKKTPVGVYFGEPGGTANAVNGEPGEAIRDPYFGGEGPDRTPCIAMRALHGWVPARVEEHACEELPLPGARSAGRG